MMRVGRRVLDAGTLLGMALLLGRFSGFGREWVLASTLGLSAQADIAIIVLTIPDLLVNLLLSGGIGVALIPALRAADGGRAGRLCLQASLLVFGLYACFGLILTVVPEWVFGLLAPGVHDVAASFNGWLLYAVAAAIPLAALSGVSTAALNAQSRFFVAGCGTLIFNTCIMAALGWAVVQSGNYLMFLCIGIFAGTLLRWLSQIYVLGGVSVRAARGLFIDWQIDGRLIRSFGAGIGAASLLVLVPVMLRSVASWLGDGEVAAFNYATKLVELPSGILITTLATVAFPRLSQAHEDRDPHAFSSILNQAVRRAVVLSLAVILCGWPLMADVVTVLFAASHADLAGQTHVARMAQIALLSLPGIGFSSLLAAGLNARRQPGRVFGAAGMAVLMLPLWMAPGLYWHRPEFLIAAVPAFYAFYSWVLWCRARATDMHLGAWLGSSLSGRLMCMCLVAVVFFLLLDWVGGHLAEVPPVVMVGVRLLLGGVCFMGLLRIGRGQSPTPAH
jgi:putative peptidoglycan lipid II flippase